MPTRLLPEPLRVVANNPFGRRCSDRPRRYRSHAHASRLNRLAPWAYCGLRSAEVCYGLRYCRALHREKDTACVDACPVDFIHPKKNTTYDDARPGFEEVPQLYIDPVECIDCGACVPVCPVSAIFALDDLPEKWKHYAEINEIYVKAGKFTPDEYAKHATK